MFFQKIKIAGDTRYFDNFLKHSVGVEYIYVYLIHNLPKSVNILLTSPYLNIHLSNYNFFLLFFYFCICSALLLFSYISVIFHFYCYSYVCISCAFALCPYLLLHWKLVLSSQIPCVWKHMVIKSMKSVKYEDCPCGSVLEHCVSNAKGCGFNSQRTKLLTKKMYNLKHCKSLWIKASAKCINIRVVYIILSLGTNAGNVQLFCLAR